MNIEQLTQELASNGLRLASDDEAGWTYSYITDEGERVTVRITDVN